MAKLLREFLVHGGGRWPGGRKTPEDYGWKRDYHSTQFDTYSHPKHPNDTLTVHRTPSIFDTVDRWEHITYHPEEGTVGRGRGTLSLAPHLERFHKGV